MIVLEKNVKNLLSKGLSIEKRGLIITAMLCKADIPAFTEAKFKSVVDYSKYKKELVELHEEGFIKWDKYRYYKKKVEEEEGKNLKPVHDAIDFMNKLYGRGFDYKSSSSKNLKARLKDYSLDDIKLVIANRWERWKDDVKMESNLNPVTIFRAELFPKYLEEANRTNKGKGIINTTSLNIDDGDEITYSISRKLIDSELYKFKVYRTDYKGNPKGNPTKTENTGKAIKVLLNVQNNLIKNSSNKEFIYIFVSK